MAQRVTVAKAADIPEGGSVVVSVRKTDVAIFRVGGVLHVDGLMELLYSEYLEGGKGAPRAVAGAVKSSPMVRSKSFTSAPPAMTLSTDWAR